MTGRDERWTAELALFGVCLIWGCNFAVMKTALEELGPLAFNAIRLTVSVLFLGAVHWFGGGRATRLPPGLWPRIFGLSLIGYFAYQVLFTTGLQRTASGNSALILSSSPVFTVITGYLIGERIERRALLGLSVAVAGAMLIALQTALAQGSTGQLAGDLLSFGAAAAWGCYTSLNRTTAERVPAATLALYTTAVTLPLHWIVGLSELGPVFRNQVSLRAWASIGYAGVLGTGLALVLWNRGLRHVGAAHTAGIVTLVPVVAVLVGWLGRGESIGWLQVLGGVGVLGGVWILRRGSAGTGTDTPAAGTPAVDGQQGRDLFRAK